MVPTLEYERSFWARGYRYVAGCDEVGRGCWAGPVVVGAVVLPIHDPAICGVLRAAGVRDSKLLSPEQRTALVPLIHEIALAYALGEAEPEEIDQIGIVPATHRAARRALSRLPIRPHALLLDAFPLPDVSLPQKAVIKGDQRSLTVATASILAKVARDTYMIRTDEQYPGYGFARHKGYGTLQHREALNTLGPSPLHRHSWRPILRLRQQEMGL